MDQREGGGGGEMIHDLFYYSFSLFIVLVASGIVLYHIVDSFRIEMYGSMVVFICCFIATSSLVVYMVYLIIETV